MQSLKTPGKKGCLTVACLAACILGCDRGEAALLVFDRVVEEGAPYFTDVAVDAAGQMHFSGFVVSEGASRAWVSKRSADGTRELWSLQFGGTAGQIATGIDLDAQGNVYVSGWTADPAFPMTQPMQGTYGGGESDGFVLKIDPTGSRLLYSTYLGGSGRDLANQIRVDAAGHVHVTGTTFSGDFPSSDAPRGGETDAFVVKLHPAGSSAVYRRRLGGSGTDLGNGLTLDRFGRALVIGTTGSTNFPVLGGLQRTNAGDLDVTVAVLDVEGAIQYATYLGGSGPDTGTGIAVDATGNLYLTGLTFSEDFPRVRAFRTELERDGCPAGQPCGDGFVTRLNAAGDALGFSTLLGGNREENITAVTSVAGTSFYGIGVDAAGFVYVTGTTASLDFPAIGGLQLTTRRRGAMDPFLAKFQPDGGVVYATWLGPGQFRAGQFRGNVGSSLAVSDLGEVWLAGASLPPTAGPGAGTGPVGYFAKVVDLPMQSTPWDGASGGGARYLGISEIRRLADASTQLTFQVPTNSGYTVEASADLRVWSPLITQQPPSEGGGIIRQ